MDGNGRWAEQKGKIRVFGHKAGVKTVRQCVNYAAKQGVEALTLFAFSSENWKRPKEEVSTLMELFMMVLNSEVKKLHKNNIKLCILGDVRGFSTTLQDKIAKSEALTAKNTGLVLNIAANYGGRWHIAEAAKELAKKVQQGEMAASDIDESVLDQQIASWPLTDVDLMIRTGGEQRISNFLLWQLAYAELFFTDTLWPDFNEQCFADAIASFSHRERRYGHTSAQVQASKQG
ncbi:di-trans,poly-cis-decaprenylcistransferase [Motilimonas pumila]|uniref:Ditrans,polycis-undecaprenyl-diphosphate synthase ((2E,6E)-farnesyl-diphosphate specific) n=2 Tax=Motilimonas pumila TaxID=2303987 RepID=A0A418YH38_9GAMM|nr:di-trans,poly-cis-decaprenylcistransferase [Motilimonas pumila]